MKLLEGFIVNAYDDDVRVGGAMGFKFGARIVGKPFRALHQQRGAGSGFRTDGGVQEEMAAPLF